MKALPPVPSAGRFPPRQKYPETGGFCPAGSGVSAAALQHVRIPAFLTQHPPLAGARQSSYRLLARLSRVVGAQALYGHG